MWTEELVEQLTKYYNKCEYLSLNTFWASVLTVSYKNKSVFQPYGGVDLFIRHNQDYLDNIAYLIRVAKTANVKLKFTWSGRLMTISVLADGNPLSVEEIASIAEEAKKNIVF